MGAIPEKIKIAAKTDGTTGENEKRLLILKDYFEIKTTRNKKSMA
jgi:hypothetical protein